MMLPSFNLYALAGFLFLLTCLAGLFYILTRFLKVPTCIAPAVIVGLVTGALFLSDFVGLMKLTSSLIIVIGLAGAILFIVNLFRESRKIDFGGNRQKLLWILIIWSCTCLYLLNIERVFSQWDEFSHWGSIIRAIYMADSFHFNPNPLYFQDYPPGTALFSYFILHILGYSEGGAFFAYSLILLAYSIPIFGLAADRGRFFLLIVFVATLILIRGLGHGWNTVLIDHILSVAFAGLLAAYLVLRERKAALWPLAFLFIPLVLAKHAGVSMALAVYALVISDAIIIFAGTKFKDRNWRWNFVLVNTKPFIFLMVPALMLTSMWAWYVNVSDFTRGYGRFGIIELLSMGLKCCSSERELIVISKFTQSYFQVNGYSPVLLTVLFVGVGIAATLHANRGLERRRQLVALILLTSIGIFFAIVQLLYYLYAFNDFEALALTSFERFLNTYYLAWALSVMAWVTLSFNKKDMYSKKVGFKILSKWIFTGLILVVLVVSARIFTGSMVDKAFLAKRIELRHWVNSLPVSVDAKSRIYIVWQGSNGFEFWQVFHEMLPRPTNWGCYSLGPKRYENDIWTCNYDERQLRSEWESYDYIAVASGYSNLQSIYPSILPNLGGDLDQAIFRVEKRDGDIYLKRLQ